jgi:sugar lactone lactonase YvrE
MSLRFGGVFRFLGGVCLALSWLALSAAQAQTTNALGTTALWVGPSAGSSSVVLAVNSPTTTWTAATNAAWLHLSPANQNGTGSANVVFSYDADPGGTRSGTLTIAGLGLTVIQAGATYMAVTTAITLAPFMTEPGGTEGPSGMAVDGAGNVYTLFDDPAFGAACDFEQWKMTNNSVVAGNLPGFMSDQVGTFAADTSGNLYIADSFDNAIREWTAANSNVTTLVSASSSTQLDAPSGVALDSLGNVYIADTGDNAIKEWTIAKSSLSTLVFAGLNAPHGVAVDIAGNVYIADTGNSAIKEWTAATGNVTTLVSSGLDQPMAVAVDGSGNIYIADNGNLALKEWTAANSNVITLLSGGRNPAGVAADSAGNLYMAGFPSEEMEELPRAFVDPTAKSESAAAGYDALPAVVPATANLLPPFAPASEQSWLAITGLTNGVVSFSFTSNSGAARTAYITLLGVSIPVTQAGFTSTATYSLGWTARVEGPAASSDSVVLAVTPATATWTATNNAAWLHLAPGYQSGSGSTNVVFSYDANPGATRSGTVAIAGQVLTVTQAGSTYIATGALTALVSSGLHFPDGVAVDGAGNVYISDTFNKAIKKWTPASNSVSTLVSSGLGSPGFIAVDGSDNVYVVSSDSILEWKAANSNLLTLVSNGLSSPVGVAVDGAGDVYIGDNGDGALKEWSAANSNLTSLVSSGLDPYGVAVDAAGNVYITDGGPIAEWSPANDMLTNLFSSIAYGIAVDGAGNVYITDSDTVLIWSAASGTVTTLVSSGLDYSDELAVDNAGNVYIADTLGDAIMELPRAFVDPTAKSETAAAGYDALPVVLPATENLLPPFAPSSDQSWLTITGVTNDVVSFSFSANTSGSSRTAHITLLGQTIPVTQGIIGTAPILTSAQMLGHGVLQFTFTNNPGASFTVLSATNLALPLSNWTVAGAASNTGSDVFQFTSQPTTNESQVFYSVRSP